MSKLSTDQQSVKLWSVVQAHHPGLIADRREKYLDPSVSDRPSPVLFLEPSPR
ncbi:hypothetical protein [Laspinema olomoucense]|uniref:hypothetical protein n=1 Tax=Laspinema olomoucense TaxID=3231600 RepID=UPI0021BA7769|nr:hypothetical protein [Laspinema sp. D3c]MCT7997390.1 hypothetical protein [Laspinema sp. D3c]